MYHGAMPKVFPDIVRPDALTSDGRPLILDGLADFLERSRTLISPVVAEQVANGRGTLCFLYQSPS